MKRCRGEVFANNKQGSMVSPLVDVVFNLIIYILVARPIQDNLPDFEPFYESNNHIVNPTHNNSSTFNLITNAVAEQSLPIYRLPDATAYGDYHTNIPVRNGEGKFFYVMTESADPLSLMENADHSDSEDSTGLRVNSPPSNSRFNEHKQTLFLDRVGTLEMNTHTGLLSARFFNTVRNNQGYGEAVIYVTVIGKRIHIPQDQCDRWGDIELYFYKKWLNGTVNSSSPSISCRRSIQARFLIRIYPKKIPYLPDRDPLTLVNSNQIVETVAGYPLQTPIAIAGGIEPYEVRLSGNVPPWLKLNHQRGHKLVANEPRTGEYLLNIEVKDAQTPTGSWYAAQQAQRTGQVGNPYQTGSIVLKVNQPLSATLLVPEYSRLGSEAKGGVLVSDGLGRKVFEAVRLPPGLNLDTASGEIRGLPTAIGNHPVEITVTDDSSTITVNADWRVIGSMPPAELVIRP